jgi:hypothetical protein
LRATYFHGKSYALIMTNDWLGHTLGDFLTRSSGHPVAPLSHSVFQR